MGRVLEVSPRGHSRMAMAAKEPSRPRQPSPRERDPVDRGAPPGSLWQPWDARGGAGGHGCCRGRVERLRRRPCLRALAGRRCRPCTTNRRHTLPVTPNLLARAASRPRSPSRLAGRRHLHLDRRGLALPFCRPRFRHPDDRRRGHARDHRRTERALSALMMTVQPQRQRPDPGLIHRSNRGSQFAAEADVARLSAAGAVPSMSRTGTCYDRAIAAPPVRARW